MCSWGELEDNMLGLDVLACLLRFLKRIEFLTQTVEHAESCNSDGSEAHIHSEGGLFECEHVYARPACVGRHCCHALWVMQQYKLWEIQIPCKQVADGRGSSRSLQWSQPSVESPGPWVRGWWPAWGRPRLWQPPLAAAAAGRRAEGIDTLCTYCHSLVLGCHLYSSLSASCLRNLSGPVPFFLVPSHSFRVCLQDFFPVRFLWGGRVSLLPPCSLPAPSPSRLLPALTLPSPAQLLFENREKLWTNMENIWTGFLQQLRCHI